MSKSIVETILVVKNRAMGDAIMGLSSIQYLKDNFPHAKIIYMVPEWIYPLFKNVKNQADLIIPLKLKTVSNAFSLAKTINKYKPQIVLELFQSGRTAKFFQIHRLVGGYQYLFHNHHLKKGESAILDQGEYKANTQRDLDGIWSHLFRDKKEEVPNHLDFIPTISPIKEIKKSKSIIFGVVATRETKMWPLNFYIDLAKMIKKDYPDISIDIPLGPGDNSIKKALSKENHLFNFIETSLENLPHEIFHNQLYVGNDTGIKHIAIALGIKSFTLFGPEPPLEWHPYDKQIHPYFYRENLECRTRNAHYCGLTTCESMICLNQISPEQVFQGIKSELSRINNE
tara:strand:+ start:78183 stop:79208 length:1026 start_codon:yes stop_codon:yes gene_type:complete